ncbi:MAG: GLPGLI family protein [Bacteroidales bacterium]
MKLKHFFPVILIFLPGLSLTAQVGEGVIRYEVTIDMHRNIPPEREEMKAMIPQHRTETYELFFNGQESLYRAKENADADLSVNRGGMRMVMRIPRTETHIDKDKREVTTLQDFMGTNYLITEPLDIAPWRIGNEQMEIAGYLCMMAWYTDTVQNQEITAWFTPQIQPFLGPDRYVTLPGTVLAVDINNGERVWVAREVEPREIHRQEVRKPSRGEQITREGYQELVRQQMERMGGTTRGMRF